MNQNSIKKNNEPRPVSYGMKPKKYLGQNFLTQPKIAMDMVHAGDIKADDVVIEIGPGKGVLTEKLLFFAGKVIAIEKDRELIPLLQEKFEKEIRSSKLEILEKDVRDFDPSIMSFYNLPYKVIANIPYYITGEIMRKFLEADCQPEQMVLMVQKEVAGRIIARDKKESILSISIKAYGTPKVIRKVSAGSFFPKPNVDSAVLSIENISKDLFIKNKISEKRFFEIIKNGFSSKRKKLSSNLGLKQDAWLKLDLPENIRAEELSLEGWLKIARTKA